jgi:tol-pal system protein YbgF
MTGKPAFPCLRPAQLWCVFGLLIVAGMSVPAVWLWSVPARAQYADQTDLSDRLERLENQVATLQRQLARGGGNAPVAAGGPVAPTQAADFEIRLSQLERTVQEMVGKYEETEFGVTQVRERLEKLSTDLDFRLSQLESRDSKGGETGAARPADTPALAKPAATSAPTPPSGTTGKGAAKPAETPSAQTQATASTASGPGLGGVPPNVQEQYDEAFGLLRKADYDQAEKSLIAFVAQHPDSPLAGNAQYWLGETYYVRGQYTEAAVAFADGFQKYPKNPKAPDNLLKLGMALASLNRKNDACKTFDQVGAQFPTAAASLKRRAEQERKKLSCP